MTAHGDAIHAHDLSVQIGTATLLREVSLEIPGGALTTILGPNGAGKTTLLRTLGGLDAPSAGEVLWGQDPWANLEALERALRVSHVGHEATPPFPWTVFELVLMGYRLAVVLVAHFAARAPVAQGLLSLVLALAMLALLPITLPALAMLALLPRALLAFAMLALSPAASLPAASTSPQLSS